MQAIEELQLFAEEALDAEGEAVHASRTEVGKLAREDGGGVRFERDFAVVAEGREQADSGDDCSDGLRLHVAGGTAAEEDGCHLAAGCDIRPSEQLIANGGRVSVLQFVEAGVGIEVAVAALNGAEGDVDVDAQASPRR